MRSSKLNHCCKKSRKHSSLCSLIVSVVIAVSVVAIPSTILIQNVHAVTIDDIDTTVSCNVDSNNKNSKFSVKNANKSKTETKKSNEKKDKVIASTEISVTPTVVDINYNPEHIELSDSDRDLLERLVTGEAASLGFDGCALVAQAVRDSMILSGTTSVSKIIKDYQYTGSTKVGKTDDAVKAVSYIFDDDMYAVKHRIIYFYATDLVTSSWHETQNYITTCANVRFFDRI